MRVLSKEMALQRRKKTVLVRERGYMPCYEEVHSQELFCVYKLFGFFVFKVIIDTEIIPNDVMLTYCCLGDVGGWRSKWSYIPEWSYLYERKSNV